MSFDLQDVGLLAPDHVLRDEDGLGLRHGFDGRPGSDPPEERQLDGPYLDVGRNELERPAPVPGALDKPLLLKVRQVLMDRRQRAEAEVLSDLLDGRGVAFPVDMAREIVEDLFLSPRQVHGSLRTEARRRSGESQG
jgi:hypothetical protein